MPFASRAIAHAPTGGGVALSSMPPFSSLLSIPCVSPLDRIDTFREIAMVRRHPPCPPWVSFEDE